MARKLVSPEPEVEQQQEPEITPESVEEVRREDTFHQAPVESESSVSGIQAQEWSYELLLRVDPRVFQQMVCHFFQEKGFMYAEADMGAEDGPDTLLYRPGETKPYAVLKCQSWCERQIGLKELRELVGTMVHIGLEHAVYVTSCCFTEAAKEFAETQDIGLMDGEMFALQLKHCNESFQLQSLAQYAPEGDAAPCCPKCGSKMQLRRERRVGKPEEKFYSCNGYPVCRNTLPYPKL